ncbi:hypothetical protein BDZ89DRAFT_1070520 [Hymenopellis radicata]|nr:hypothetical protein BDZ89DRAFT_1070520 [Hymenopellis radicata]
MRSHPSLHCMTYISTVQAGYCYCMYEDSYLSELVPITSSTKQCCLDVTGTDKLHHVVLGEDIYCDTGDNSGSFEQCCESKGDVLYCR